MSRHVEGLCRASLVCGACWSRASKKSSEKSWTNAGQESGEGVAIQIAAPLCPVPPTMKRRDKFVFC